METFQLRDPELARDYILESMLLSRAQLVTSETFELGLRLAMEIASEGSPLPPVGLVCLLYTSPSPRDGLLSRMPSSA